MNKYNNTTQLSASIAAAIIFGVISIWFFKSYYVEYPPREAAYDKAGNLLKLRQVIMIFRHGLRSPSQPLNLTSGSEPIQLQDGYGQLTKEGKFNLYEMGKSMRRRYYDFITPHNIYMDADVRAVSTNMDRCLESVGLLLAGLYPPEGRQTWNQKLRWQPVPVKSITPDKAYVLLAGPSTCPLYYKTMDIVNITNELSDKLFASFSKYVAFSDDPQTRILELFIACDSVVSLKKMNKPLPTWLNDIFSDVINFLKGCFCYIARNKQLQRLFSGPLLADIVAQMNNVVTDNQPSKIYLYSGHDTSVTALLDSLGLPSCILPDYGASVLFELYSSQRDEYYAKVLYNEDTSFLKVENKILPQCGQPLCPLDKFIDIVKPLFMTEDEWKKECNSVQVS